jgi:hypothetical protein
MITPSPLSSGQADRARGRGRFRRGPSVIVPPPFSFVWRIPIRGTHRSDEWQCALVYTLGRARAAARPRRPARVLGTRPGGGRGRGAGGRGAGGCRGLAAGLAWGESVMKCQYSPNRAQFQL